MLGNSMGDSMLTTNTGFGGSEDKIVRTRYAYFQPTASLSRCGEVDEVPGQLRGDDIDVPYFVKRAINL